jgi:hypothetical protein
MAFEVDGIAGTSVEDAVVPDRDDGVGPLPDCSPAAAKLPSELCRILVWMT